MNKYAFKVYNIVQYGGIILFLTGWLFTHNLAFLVGGFCLLVLACAMIYLKQIIHDMRVELFKRDIERTKEELEFRKFICLFNVEKTHRKEESILNKGKKETESPD